MSASAAALRSNPWLEYVNVMPAARSRLFCFAYAGGSASIYRQWFGGPLATLELCPVQLPGRERRLHERPYERMLPLVKSVIPNLPLEKPFALFGHSLGALLAFEIARELRRQNAPAPFHLFVSAAPGPHLCPNRPARHLLPREEFISEIRKLGGTPEEALTSHELLDLMLPTLRADFALIDTYNYRDEEPLDCPITAIAGDRDREVDPVDVMHWREQTRAPFGFQRLPGDHFFLTQFGPRVQEIVAAGIDRGVIARVAHGEKSTVARNHKK
jgi:medium-chain acyl-[acyl-carrier-protein] hydrolase